MPYGRQHRRPLQGSSGRTVTTQFVNADMSPGVSVDYTEHTAMTPNGDVHTAKQHCKLELACGCLWPDTEVHGVCSVCVQTQPNASVCEAHHVVCECGASVCRKHSRAFPEDSGRRLCIPCYRKEKNRAFFGSFLCALGRAICWIFFKHPE